MLNYSVCKFAFDDGNIKLSASEPVTADSFQSAMFNVIDLGARVKNGRHPKDSPDGTTNIPMVAPARFPDRGTKKAPGMQWSFGGLDWDCKGAPATMDEAVQRLGRVRSFIHTTTHHSLATPSYRVFVDLTRYLDAHEIPAFLEHMNDRLKGGVNLTAKDVSRRFFVPWGQYESRMLWDDEHNRIDPDRFQHLVPAPYVRPSPKPNQEHICDDEFTWLRKHAYVKATINYVCEAIVNAPDGDQNNIIYKSAARLGSLVKVGVLDEVGEIDGRPITEETLIARLLLACADGKHPEHRSISAVKSGFKKGLEDGNARSLDEQMDIAERAGPPRSTTDRVMKRIGKMRR